VVTGKISEWASLGGRNTGFYIAIGKRTHSLLLVAGLLFGCFFSCFLLAKRQRNWSRATLVSNFFQAGIQERINEFKVAYPYCGSCHHVPEQAIKDREIGAALTQSHWLHQPSLFSRKGPAGPDRSIYRSGRVSQRRRLTRFERESSSVILMAMQLCCWCSVRPRINSLSGII